MDNRLTLQLEHRRRKLTKSAAFRVWIRMAISRLGRIAVAGSSLVGLAAIVIWFGILEPRRSLPGRATLISAAEPNSVGVR